MTFCLSLQWLINTTPMVSNTFQWLVAIRPRQDLLFVFFISKFIILGKNQQSVVPHSPITLEGAKYSTSHAHSPIPSLCLVFRV